VLPTSLPGSPCGQAIAGRWHSHRRDVAPPPATTSPPPAPSWAPPSASSSSRSRSTTSGPRCCSCL